MDTAFILLTVLSILILIWIARSMKVGIIMATWAGILSLLAHIGFFEDTPRLFVFVLIGTVAVSLILYVKLKDRVKASVEIYLIHIVRIPVEFILFKLYNSGDVPIEMTFRGWNFDLFFGVTGLVIASLKLFTKINVPGRLLVIWNILGIISLCSVLLIGILSSPLPIQVIGFEQPNTAVLRFPFILLPSVIVPLVLLFHILELRKSARH